MTVVPMLGDWEVPRIAMMRSEEARKFAEFPVPGRRGSLFQDLDAEAAVIEIAGALYAEEETAPFMREARRRFTAAEPLTFVADITEATDIQYVLIEHLVLELRGDRPGELGYRLRLRESPPPPPPSDPFGGIAGDLMAEAGALVEGVTSALDALDALADLPDFSDPSALLGGTTDEASAAIDRLGEIGGRLQALFGGS
ncbi:hypothetical protein BKE38_02755 [Pseudoroseomonas deserti]|uniref:Uncharacterized protein n=1 Tax=Teichococcus deserti TaxID=1817963 RepID=A0A1V2H8F8_9PROT|nr:hypothetical protein [Pseudoroseomonas deserti]ONG58579.1 hypothetical protein BKE38_02755 [Pseudoroseomonas deserti]